MARRHEEWVIALIGELSPVAQSDLLQHLTCSSGASTSIPDLERDRFTQARACA